MSEKCALINSMIKSVKTSCVQVKRRMFITLFRQYKLIFIVSVMVHTIDANWNLATGNIFHDNLPLSTRVTKDRVKKLAWSSFELEQKCFSFNWSTIYARSSRAIVRENSSLRLWTAGLRCRCLTGEREIMIRSVVMSDWFDWNENSAESKLSLIISWLKIARLIKLSSTLDMSEKKVSSSFLSAKS